MDRDANPLRELGREMAERVREIAERGREMAERVREIAERGREMAERGREMAERVREIAERGREIAERGREMAERGREMAERGREMAERGREMAERGREMAERVREIAERGREMAERCRERAERRRERAQRLQVLEPDIEEAVLVIRDDVGSSTQRISSRSTTPRPLGLTKSELDVLPTAVHNRDRPSDGEAGFSDVRCSICLKDFETGDQKRILPCIHNFHTECAEKWLRRNATCTVCRHLIK